MSTLCDYLGLPKHLFDSLDIEIEENWGNSDQMLYNYYFYVKKGTPQEILNLKCWEVGDMVEIPVDVFADEEPDF
ncbi:hypothetical protein [Pseudoalteromonas sp. R3]|uniref:hypothetical protein n=1 Tax=Pseudoalteromonas sp. R3 TaxID=1709477 RepID=UPI0006B46406|nr:hypothetical protein [Pseudoalteromonas sp. R3]AZZ98264.1 hypothetical protein ELR70_14750 [Pseudoalteromonas sp. R3]